MQESSGVAVLATQLARTDRRALSQAWYSALHLAGDAPSRIAARTPVAGAPPRGGSSPAPGHDVSRTAPRGVDARGARVPAPRTGAEPGSERRLARTELGRSIERGIARRAPHRGAVSFAIRTRAGRIHLSLRSDGVRTRVVAVCAAPLRERVERALAHARFALAGRGVRAEGAL